MDIKDSLDQELPKSIIKAAAPADLDLLPPIFLLTVVKKNQSTKIKNRRPCREWNSKTNMQDISI